MKKLIIIVFVVGLLIGFVVGLICAEDRIEVDGKYIKTVPVLKYNVE